jgi:hypothetical protein
MSFLNESSYYVDIAYDALYDDHCFTTRYRFETEELAKKFSEHINLLKMVFVSEIYFEEQRDICGYTKSDPYRPRFSVLDDAINDLNNLINYCNNYFSFSEERIKKYKYFGNIDVESIEIVEKLHLNKQIDNLKTEVDNFKNEIDRLKKENEKLKLELDLINNTNYSSSHIFTNE